jgi:hypothetical protein
MAADNSEKLLVLLEANTKQFENAMKKVGLLTQQQMQKAANSNKVLNDELRRTEKEAAAVTAQLDKMETELATAAAKAVAPMKLTNQQLAGMQFQLQDLGVQLASGQSPFMAIVQQGSQIGQMFGPGSTVMGALKATGAGIAAFLTNPINLAIMGFALAAAAAPAIWSALTGPEAKSAEDLLKDVDAQLAELTKGFEEAGDAAQRMLDKVQSADVMRATLEGTADELRVGIAQAIDVVSAKTNSFITSWQDISPELLATQNDIREMGAALADGNITVKAFRDFIAGIRLSDNLPEPVHQLADELLAATNEARQLENALLGVEAANAAIANSVAVDPARFGEGLSTRSEIMAQLDKDLRSQADLLNGPTPKRAARGGKTQREKDVDIVTREQEAIRSLLDDLRAEGELIGLTDLKRQQANATRNLGLSATETQIAQVEQLIAQNYREQESLDALVDAQGFFADASFSALDALIQGGKEADDVIVELGKSLAMAALQATLLGQGPLAGLFGTTSSGGVLGSLFGALLGVPGRAEGGPISAGRPYVVGERGPELILPKSAGTVIPNEQLGGRAGGGSMATTINIDARGAQAGVGQEIRRALAEYDKGSYSRHVANSYQGRRRGDLR